MAELVSLPEIKEFLSISLGNTQEDSRLLTLAKQVSTMINNYCGREFAAQDREEYFDGGTSSVFVSSPPINSVFSVQGPGVSLTSPSRAGSPITNDREALTVSLLDSAHLTTRIKKNGQSSLKISGGGYALIHSHDSLELGVDDFTIDVWVRFDSVDTPQEILSQDGGWSVSVDAGKLLFDASDTVLIEENVVFEYKPNRFYRIGVKRKDGTTSLYRNNVQIASSNLDYYLENLPIKVGAGMSGYVDNLYISRAFEKFSSAYPPIPYDKTVVSISFDGPEGSTNAFDSVPSSGDFAFNAETGEIMFDASSGRSSLSLSGPTTFGSSPRSIKVTYNGGFSEIPDDLKLATLEMLKIVYKGKTGTETNSMRGESMNAFPLAIDDFPPQVRRILNLYRIVM